MLRVRLASPAVCSPPRRFVITPDIAGGTNPRSRPLSTLRIHHVPGDAEARFYIQRLPSGKTTTKPATIIAPADFPVQGRPDSNLVRELRWYLEEFLGYPFPPETDHAERVLDALHKWGRQAFDALFDSGEGMESLLDAQEGGGYDRLTLQIASDDPRILAWPWEVMEDRQSGLLAHSCRIERRVDQVADPPPLHKRLPRDRVNILLVTARPYKGDVRLRSISRPLVELINKQDLPAHVTILRPPTFDQLRRHLHENPHTYHVLHFDGHGGYGDDHTDHPPHAGSHCYHSRGVLVFEKPDGSPDEIDAEQLTNLLHEYAVPAVVLNACQSAMIDERAADPFASVAAALLKSGTRSVVAMAYSLYVSGARQFVPAFYERLFESGDLAQAVRAGRQQMFQHKGRICAAGEFPLDDWLVPVVYQQEPLDFSFVTKKRTKKSAPPESKLPPEARETENPHGFIGRDGPLLGLERAMLRPPAGILIQGLGGVGKTALARGFVEWLDLTGGLGAGCFWLDFREIRSAEFVINRIGEAIFGGQFSAAKMDDKLDKLAAALRDERIVMVWDNFEVARGIKGTSVSANLNDDDQAVLHRFLKSLRDTKSKVLITSRSPEDWLSHEDCYTLSISGFDDEERWEYCATVLHDLGLHPDRDDSAMIDLMDALGGHPLAMRAILPELKTHSPKSLAEALRTNADALNLPESEVSKKLAATLRFVQDALPPEQRPLLIPLSLHENFVDLNFLEHMAKRVDDTMTRAVIDRFASALSTAGLLRDRGQATHELHPALTGYLRATVARTTPNEERDAWARAFVDIMARLADDLAPRPIHEQRFAFHVHGANFHRALAEAGRLESNLPLYALLQSLAAYAQNTRDFAAAERLYTRLGKTHHVAGDHKGEAAAFHQLGMIAEEQRDFAGAEKWYRKSLAIKEKMGNERGAALTHHQLGRIAEERRDFAAAERWYRKSLATKEKLGNDHDAASTYHQLGTIAAEQRDFAAAERWYRKTLAIEEKLGNDYDAAITYHQLGVIAQEQRDFAAAEQWYRKSLAVKEKQGDDHGAATTYHQLGTIVQQQRNFTAAEQWYRKAVGVFERLGDEHLAAMTYHQLGMIAEEQRDFSAAERWYRKSLVILERLGDEHGAASTYHQLGRIAEGQHDFATAEKNYRKSLAIEEKQGNEHGAAMTYHQLGRIAEEQRDFAAAERWYRKSLTIEEKQDNEHGAAITHAQLGTMAGCQERFEESAQWLIKSIVAFARCNDPHGAQQAASNFMVFHNRAPADVQARLAAMWRDAGLGPLPTTPTPARSKRTRKASAKKPAAKRTATRATKTRSKPKRAPAANQPTPKPKTAKSATRKASPKPKAQTRTPNPSAPKPRPKKKR